MERIDHCKNLIHFTKGKTSLTSYEDAYETFLTIIRSGS